MLFNKCEDWYEMEAVSIKYLINNVLAHYFTKYAFLKTALISGITYNIYTYGEHSN